MKTLRCVLSIFIFKVQQKACTIKKNHNSSKLSEEFDTKTKSSKKKGGATATTSTIQNLSTYDPFKDVLDDTQQLDEETANFEEKKAASIVHLRLQKRNGRKVITIIEGLPEELDFKKLVSHFKKEYCCTGTVIEDEETGSSVIQLTGDQRDDVANFLVEEGLAIKSNIKIHGY